MTLIKLCLSIVIRFWRNLINRWVEEWKNFRNSRKELLLLKEFRIALILNSIPFFIISFLTLFGNSGLLPGLLVFILLLSVYFWLAGIWFIMVGNVLFDQIPVVSNISGIVDWVDGLWLEKSKQISVIVKKKERFESWITSFLRQLLVFFTIFLFNKGKKLVSNSLRKIKNFDLAEIIILPLCFSVFLIPIVAMAMIGVFWVLAYLRLSIARIPILFSAMLYFLLLAIVFIPLSDKYVWLLILLPSMILVGYTFFFAEKKDLLMIKEVSTHVIKQTF